MVVIIVMVNWSYHDKYCIKNSVPVHSLKSSRNLDSQGSGSVKPLIVTLHLPCSDQSGPDIRRQTNIYIFPSLLDRVREKVVKLTNSKEMWRQRAQHLVLILTHGVESCTNIDNQTPSSGWAVKCSHRRYQTFGRGSQQPGCCPRRCRSDCCHTWERRVCNLGQLLSLMFDQPESEVPEERGLVKI